MDRTQADIQEMISNEAIFLPLKEKIVMVTGATGLIGSMLVKSFITANDRYDLRIKVIINIRNFKKEKTVYGELFENIRFVIEPNVYCDYIIHTVSPTASKFFIEYPVETIENSVKRAMEVLELAQNNNATMVFLPLMEQYGVPYEVGQKMTEDKVGVIAHLNIRSSYPTAKRLCECICASYAPECDLNVKIVRWDQTFGGGVSLTDNRMPMQFARAVIGKKDIILHTEGKSVREIAELVCEDVADGKISVRVEEKKHGICAWRDYVFRQRKT